MSEVEVGDLSMRWISILLKKLQRSTASHVLGATDRDKISVLVIGSRPLTYIEIRRCQPTNDIGPADQPYCDHIHSVLAGNLCSDETLSDHHEYQSWLVLQDNDKKRKSRAHFSSSLTRGQLRTVLCILSCYPDWKYFAFGSTVLPVRLGLHIRCLNSRRWMIWLVGPRPAGSRMHDGLSALRSSGELRADDDLLTRCGRRSVGTCSSVGSELLSSKYSLMGLRITPSRHGDLSAP